MDPYQRALFENRPRWYLDPSPGDLIETPDGWTREVTGRPGGLVEFRDRYRRASVVTVASWRWWANAHWASIRHYGS